MSEILPFEDHQLAGNATVPEKAAAALGILADKLVDPIRRMKDAYTVPAEALVPTGWERSVDIWDATWPEARKRQVIAESLAFHRAKSTIAADRMALSYVDATLISYHLPRDNFEMASRADGADHLARLNSLPEIRIYPRPPRPTVGEPLLTVEVSPACLADPLPSARYAELRRGDTVTPLVVSGETISPDGAALTEIERVAIPKPDEGTLAAGETAFDAPIGADPSSRRVFTFGWAAATNDPFKLRPGVPTLRPAETRPRKVAIPRPHDPTHLIAGESDIHGEIAPNPPRETWYLAIRVADGSSFSGEAPGLGAIGIDRLPRERFTKELSVLSSIAPRDGFPFSSSEILPDPDARAARILDAVSAAQAARDTVYVDFNTVTPLTVADLATVDAMTRVGDSRIALKR